MEEWKTQITGVAKTSLREKEMCKNIIKKQKTYDRKIVNVT